MESNEAIATGVSPSFPVAPAVDEPPGLMFGGLPRRHGGSARLPPLPRAATSSSNEPSPSVLTPAASSAHSKTKRFSLPRRKSSVDQRRVTLVRPFEASMSDENRKKSKERRESIDVGYAIACSDSYAGTSGHFDGRTRLQSLTVSEEPEVEGSF